MAEASDDAMILISISWQALKRAELGYEPTMISDCTVVLVFSCYFIEAYLNRIIEIMGEEENMRNFLKQAHPGVQSKLAWFYNEYVARDKAKTKDQFGSKEIYRKLKRKFRGFGKLYDFRNKVSHGVIDLSLANLEEVRTLRNQAKAIVESLVHIAEKSGYVIPRDITYEEAISENESSFQLGLVSGFILSGYKSS